MPPSWVLDNLPPEWREKVKSGKAGIVRDPRMGYMICREIDMELRCYKILRKINSSILAILAVLREGCATITEVAHRLGSPYDYTRYQLYYYYKAGLLTRVGLLFCVNHEHPQINSLLMLINKRQFSESGDSCRFVEIRGDKPVQQSLNKNERVENKKIDSFGGESLDPSEILRRAEELAKKSNDELSDVERLVIERLVEWRNSRNRWYVCVESPEELRDVLNINTSATEVSAALKHLETLGIVYRFYSKRDRKHCIRIDRSLVSKV